MACCTETIRCQEARRIAERYYDVLLSRAGAVSKQELANDLKIEYTQHLYKAGVIKYGTTAVPTRPETW